MIIHSLRVVVCAFVVASATAAAAQGGSTSSEDELDFLLGFEESPASPQPPSDQEGDSGPDSGNGAQADASAAPAVGAEQASESESAKGSEAESRDERVDTIPVEPIRAQAQPEDQIAPRARSRMIEEIVVTAQKREENLQDVPIAISAFSGETLNNLGITDTRDLSRLVPGFNANESGRNTTLFTLRGVGFSDTTYTATNTVGVYIDEVSLPYAVMTRGANLDIERVEVLKGPQGTLYGRNTTGGLINYIAKAPTEEFEAGTLTSYNSYHTLESENFISGPLTDTLAGRLAFKVVRADEGWQISNVRRGDERLGEQDKLSARGSVDWRPNDDLLVRFRAEGWRDRSDPTAPQAVGVIPGNPFIGEAGLNPEIRDYPYLGNNADPRLADWPIDPPEQYPGQLDDSFHMESIKAIWDISDTMALTAIASHLAQKADGSPQLQGLHISATDLITTADIKTSAFELRLADTWWDGAFYWSFGGMVSRDEAFEQELADTTNAGALFAVANTIPIFTGPVTDKVLLTGEPTIKQRAVFLNTDTRLSESVSLNLGVRYSENDQDYRFCATEPEDANADGIGVGLSNVFTGLSLLAATQYTLATGRPGRPSIVVKGDCFSLGEDGNNDPFVDQLNESNISGRLALSYKTEDDSLYFASVSRGFKAGGFPVLNPARKSQLVPVVQEELLAYELGAKMSFNDGLVFVGLGAFYYDYTDKQLLTKTLDDVFGPLPILQNAPKSTVHGAELELRLNPLDGLFLAVAGSYVKTEIDEFVGTNSEGNTQDFAGLPFNFAPEVQISVVGDYTRPVSADLDLGIAVDYYYTSDTNGSIDQNPLLAMEEYGLLGGRLHLGSSDGDWTVSLFGRNLTNELANMGSNSWSEAVTRHVARPRTYGISFNYLWR